MEKSCFSFDTKVLVIGNFTIACSKQAPGINAEIPFAGMAFYHPGESRHDFTFTVNKAEPYTEGTLLYGSEDFFVPTFLTQRADGSYDWKTQQKNGETKLSFHISEDWTEFNLYEDDTNTKGAEAFREFGSLFSYAVLNHDACVLHGVVMEYNGMGILVTAASCTGKTTHTRMWREIENALILNGDRCLCRKTDGVWYAYGMPWSGSSGEYINRRVPITAIVVLERGEKNYVEQMNVFDGTIALMQRVFAPVWRCEMQEAAFGYTEELAASIPVLKLHCRPDPESVQVLKEAILKL